MTEFLGDTEIAAPLLDRAPCASTALALAAGPPDPPHAARSTSRARTCAGQLLDIKVHDHVIIGSGTEAYVSLAERGAV